MLLRHFSSAGAAGDNLAGLHAAFGTVMALLHKQRSLNPAVHAQCTTGSIGSAGAADGLGQVVDASISESIFNMLEACVSEVAMAGDDRQPSGSTISGQRGSLLHQEAF
jgi:crotonobetainyl-CoA:carnitine CoA-transferase CaiB-like acyl-CoA transferase